MEELENNFVNKGDLIKISKAKKALRRGYLLGWSYEVFMVSKVHSAYPTTYELHDLKVGAMKERFYTNELQKISKRSDDYSFALMSALQDYKIVIQHAFIIC
ncbi:chromo domain-containing protein [Nephila pilipes]|uniref:Chromo domain-containing protein n=1 Tax=Nephila pilipes TaxID=299642 RepID=A0A8X6MZF5_NEPPI|nr:chromo domain-containing protein [Nephila pilipes]